MAYPQVRSVGTVTSGTGPLTVSLPAGWQEGDILLLVCETANQDPTAWPPSGYTGVISTGAGAAGTDTGMKLLVAWKRANASESNVTVTDSGDHQSAVLLAIEGCVTGSSPVYSSISAIRVTDASSITWPASLSVSNDSLVIYFVAGNRDATSTSDVTAFNNPDLALVTSHVNSWHTNGFGGGLFVGSGVDYEAGAFSSATANITTQTFVYGLAILTPQTVAVYADALEPAYTIYEAIESDYVVEYDLSQSATLAASWFDRITTDGGDYNTWYDLETYNGEVAPSRDLDVTWNTAGSVYESIVFEYDTYAYRENDYNVSYTVDGDEGTIGGGGALPYASVESIYSNLWKIYYGAPYQDRQVVYQVKISASRDISTVYTVYTAPQADLEVTYQMAGPQEQDLTAEYDVTEAIEQDFSPQYDINERVTQDLVAQYQVGADIAISDFDAEYNLTASIEQDLEVVADVLNPVDPSEFASVFQIWNAAQANFSCAWEVPQALYAQNIVTVRYDIAEAAIIVPNLKGMTIKQARQVLRERNLRLGNISYGT